MAHRIQDQPVPVGGEEEQAPFDGYHRLRIRRVIDETSEARSFELDVPADLQELFAYRAGQFCSFRVEVAGETLVRCYSMSSSADVGEQLKVTVKRVPGGRVSNWMNEHLAEGSTIDVLPPAGRFCLKTDQGSSARRIVAFSGGSGITPVMSLVKSALATTGRGIRLLYANRDRESIIFRQELEGLALEHPQRLEIQHRLDVEDGFVQGEHIAAFIGDDLDADFYICGPGPFMDIVERTLETMGVAPGRVFIERFVSPAAPAATPAPTAVAVPTVSETQRVTLVIHGRTHTFDYHPGDTVLGGARRARVATPFSCEMGDCGTCIAHLRDGEVKMRANNVLTPDELAEGLVLTCQSLPLTETVVLHFEG